MSAQPGTIARFLRAFSYAGQGVWHGIRHERNMRVHLVAAAAAIAAAVIVGVSATDWACLALAIGLVLAAETINTAVEAAVDLRTRDVHPLAKIAKDAAAGAVLITAVTAVAVGIAVFLPYVLR